MVEVECKEHGPFSVRANNHLLNVGCKICGAYHAAAQHAVTFEDFVARMNRVHESKYTYKQLNPDNPRARDNFEINCTEHGPFTITYDNHSMGRGCPMCANSGFKCDKPGYLYVLTSGELTKVGITNRAVKTRLYDINRSGKNFRVVSEFWFDLGQRAYDLERYMLRYLRSKYMQPTEQFDGYTECFYEVCHDDLFKKLNEGLSI